MRMDEAFAKSVCEEISALANTWRDGVMEKVKESSKQIREKLGIDANLQWEKNKVRRC